MNSKQWNNPKNYAGGRPKAKDVRRKVRRTAAEAGPRARGRWKTYISSMRLISIHTAVTVVIALQLCAILSVSAQDTDTSETASDSGSVHRRVFVDDTRDAWHASVAGNGGGLSFCAWTERTASGASIRASFLARTQRSDFDVIEASTPPPGAEDDWPAVVFLDDSTVLLAWQRRERGRHFLRARVVSRSGSLGPEQSVSDDEAGSMMPAAGRGADGEVLIAWQDYRNGNPDIYARRFDRDGRAVGGSVLLNDDGGAAMQGGPHIAGSGGRPVVFWPDNREDGAWKFYYQRVGDPRTPNVLIDSAQRKAMTTLISGVLLSGDSALFTWKDYREGHSNIYRRFADLRTGHLSPAERVNDDRGERWQRLAVTGADRRGRSVICWEDYRNTENNQRGDIYAQVYDASGRAYGRNIRINDREDRIARKMPKIVMDDDGWYLVLWHQGEEGHFHLAGQWLRYPHIREGANFCLTCGPSYEE